MKIMQLRWRMWYGVLGVVALSLITFLFLPFRTVQEALPEGRSPILCSDRNHAEYSLATAQGTSLRMIVMVAGQETVARVLAAFPSVKLLSCSKRIMSCEVPLGVAREWVSRGLSIEGVLAFDVEKEIELYGAVATSATFLGTAPLQENSALDGGGEIVAVIDTGISTGVVDTFHKELLPALYGMTVEPSIKSSGNLTPEDTDEGSHGTHVAGCVVAQGIWNTKIRGSAPGAALYFQRILYGGKLYISPDIASHFERSQAVGARIVNCSWGTESYFLPTYDTYSLSIDTYVWNNPEMLICVAVGNAGVDADQDNVIDLQSIYSSLPYAKNVLAVGAQESNRPGISNTNSALYKSESQPGNVIANDKIAAPCDRLHPGMLAISSRGPLTDGRISPMLVAPGSVIYSTNRSGGVLALSGTSMAAPFVSGAAAVWRQYLREVKGLTTPTMALVRAGLILASETLYPGQYGTGAMLEIPETSPNAVEGWGALHLGKMLQGGAQGLASLHLKDRIRLKQTGESETITIEGVQANTTLRVVLSWVDAPVPTPLGSRENPLMNDYDLEVTSPSGKSYTVNDHQNPIERLLIPVEDDAGTWTVCVKAATIEEDGDGNLAAIVCQAVTDKAPEPLPKKDGEKVTVTVSLPEGCRPYLDYPVWPAPGTHTVSATRPLLVQRGAKLPYNEPPSELSGWILKRRDGVVRQGRDAATTLLPQQADELKWYERFPGMIFKLK